MYIKEFKIPQSVNLYSTLAGQEEILERDQGVPASKTVFVKWGAISSHWKSSFATTHSYWLFLRLGWSGFIYNSLVSPFNVVLMRMSCIYINFV